MDPLQPLPEDGLAPDGEFHHFQLVNQQGEIPMSISVLIHVNPTSLNKPVQSLNPITTNDVIDLHNALEQFNGDFLSAFNAI